MFPRLYLSSLFYCASILTPSLILINLTQPEPRNNLKFDSPPSLIFSTTTYRNSLTSSSFEGRKGGRIFPHPAFVASRWPRSTGRTGMRACYAHMHVGWRFGQVWRLDSTRLDQRADAHAHRCASARHTGPRQGPRAAFTDVHTPPPLPINTRNRGVHRGAAGYAACTVTHSGALEQRRPLPHYPLAHSAANRQNTRMMTIQGSWGERGGTVEAQEGFAVAEHARVYIRIHIYVCICICIYIYMPA